MLDFACLADPFVDVPLVLAAKTKQNLLSLPVMFFIRVLGLHLSDFSGRIRVKRNQLGDLGVEGSVYVFVGRGSKPSPVKRI